MKRKWPRNVSSIARPRLESSEKKVEVTCIERVCLLISIEEVYDKASVFGFWIARFQGEDVEPAPHLGHLRGIADGDNDRSSSTNILWRQTRTRKHFPPFIVFYDKLNAVLEAGGFDRFVEELCAPHYAEDVGRPSIPHVVKTLPPLIGGLRRSKALGKATLQMLPGAEKMIRGMDQALADMEARRTVVQEARATRAAIAQNWETALAALKRGARAAADDGATDLIRDSVRSAGAAVK